MTIPGGSLYPRVSRVDAEPRVVRLDAAAGPLLERAFTSTASARDGSHAVFEVWFDPAEKDADVVAVHIGSARVGTLDKDASNRLKAVMKSAGRLDPRHLRAAGTATLARAEDFRPPFLLVVPIR
jgi:hypothetical protein